MMMATPVAEPVRVTVHVPLVKLQLTIDGATKPLAAKTTVPLGRVGAEEAVLATVAVQADP